MPQDMSVIKSRPKAKAVAVGSGPQQSVFEKEPGFRPERSLGAVMSRDAWQFDVRIAESDRAAYVRSLDKVKAVVQSAAYVAEGLRAVTETMRGEQQAAVINATSFMLSEMLRGYLADDLDRIERLERMVATAPEADEADQLQWDGEYYFDPRRRAASGGTHD